MKSWKTTLCGVLGAIAAVITLVAVPLMDNDESTNPNWAGMGTALATAAGLFFAKDHEAPTAAPTDDSAGEPQ
jgi:hypothetical protein